MKTMELEQGSQLWLNHRRTHRNASDTPCVTGHSPYKTRSKFMGEYVSGIVEDTDDATQSRFADGHRSERLARPLMAQIIGEDLSPVVGVSGVWSASFDGLTFDEMIAAEHKALNDTLRAVSCATELPIYYREQMEHQLMVCGGEKCLFMASKWNDDDTLAEEVHFWYEPDLALRAQIIAAWDMFEKDVAAYVPSEVKEMPKAEVTIDLPALFVHAKGEITEHNMEAFGVALTAKLAEVRAIDLITDQDFSNAKEAAKKFRDTAKAIALSKEAMLAQTETIGEAARKMDAWVKDLNGTALQLEKDVEREDLAKKTAMVTAAALAFREHIEALEVETCLIKLATPKPDFALAIKGKRNYASMQDALDTALAIDGKAKADAEAKDIRAKLSWCKENASGMSFLFPDLAQIITKPLDDFTLLIATRIKDHNDAEAKKLEEQTARIRAEEEAKAKAKVEEEQRQEAEAQAKIDREAAEKLKAEQDAIDAAAKTSARTKCDGNHGGPRCCDPECWNTDTAPVAKPADIVVIEHQDVISAFLASRDFGKEAGKVRAILVEFVKFSAQFNNKKAA